MSPATPGPGSWISHSSGVTLEDRTDAPPEAGTSGNHAAVMPTWPSNTDIVPANGRSKLNLLEQPPLVRIVLQDAIDFVHSDLIFKHAFPNADMANNSVRAALVKAAKARYPVTAAVLNRLCSDSEYSANLSRIVSIPYHLTALLTFLIAA